MHRTPLTLPAVTATIFIAAGLAHADTPAPPDKRGYNLFDPVPRDMMRPLTADRPDVTESPVTVDPGHIQVEASLVDYRMDDRNRDDNRVETLTVGATNIKFGLLHNVDLQLVFDAYVNQRTHDQAARTADRDEGFGDTTVRLKVNLWGNDGGATAFGVMPFMTFPTASDGLTHDHVEGGLILPFAMDLPHEFSLGLMAEFDAVYDEADDDYDMEFVHTVALGRDIIGPLAAYVEYVGVSATDGPYQAILGTGLTYLINPDWQIDAGVNLGLNRAADDINTFVGLTVRY